MHLGGSSSPNSFSREHLMPVAFPHSHAGKCFPISPGFVRKASRYPNEKLVDASILDTAKLRKQKGVLVGTMSSKDSERLEACRCFIYSKKQIGRGKKSDPQAENKPKQMDLILYQSANIIAQRKMILSNSENSNLI